MSLKKGNITISGLGVEGYSPSANVSQSGDTTTITITDKTGTTTANIDLSNKQDIIQYETLPTASASNEGQIVQYIGIDTNDYTNGYFYKCVEDSGSYSWENVEVQQASEAEEVIVFSSSDDASTKILKAQQLIDCLKNNNYIPRMFYYDNSGSHEVIYSGNALTSYTTNIYLAVSYYDNYTDKYYGTPKFYYKGRIRITLQDYVVANAYYQFNSDYNREFNLLAPYGEIVGGDATIESYKNSCSALSVTNTTAYTPTADYNPSTKKYVDDSISSAIGSINTILATLTTPSNGGGN